MDCGDIREALSAITDGEDPGMRPALLDEHLQHCAACRCWYSDAEEVNRLAGLRSAEPPAAGLADAVLDRVTLPRVGRMARPLRAALLATALAQLGIGVASLFLAIGMHAGGTPSAHMDHETAAFNLAFGVAMLLVALNSRRAATQLPVLACFVGVLAVASAVDLADGAVGWSRLATHIPVVLGLVLIACLRRAGPTPSAPPNRTGLAPALGRLRGRDPLHDVQRGAPAPADPPSAVHREAA